MTRSFEQAGVQAGDLSGMAMMNMAVNGFCEQSAELGDAVTPFVNGGIKYLIDQWASYMVGALGITGQRVATPFPSMPRVQSGLKLTAPSLVVPGANDQAQIFQHIEGNRTKNLAWGTALGLPLTVGFVVRPSFNWTASANITNGAANNRNFIKRIYAPANQDTFVPLTYYPDGLGTWAKDNTAGTALTISLAAGASRQGNYEQWYPNTNFLSGADITNLCAAAGQSVIVSGLVMLPGIVPISKETLPLMARHLPDERYLCWRYWEPLKVTVTTSPQYLQTPFKAQKRTISPTFSTGQDLRGSVWIVSYNTFEGGASGLRMDTPGSSPNDVIFLVNDRM